MVRSVGAAMAMGLVLTGGCKDAPVTVEATTSAPSAAADALALPPPIPTPTPTREALQPMPPGDAGITGCTTQVRATKLARPGPYAAVARVGGVDLYTQERGAPVHVGSIEGLGEGLGESRAAVIPAPPVPGVSTAGTPECAAAGTTLFCANANGEVFRYRVGPKAPSMLPEGSTAHARPGGAITAALVSGSALVVFPRERTTSEGLITQAFVRASDGSELRLSDDGAGATSVALATRGDSAIAVYVDARRAMSPVHARTVVVAPKLSLGKDAVLFVGGSAETYTRVSLGVRGTTAYALLPVAHELAFGLGVVKLEGEPVTDAPIVWSDYPNGLDPAPIAATTGDAHATYVARVRPSAPKFGSPRVLEIGELGPSGDFTAYGVLPTQGNPTDVVIVSDGPGAFVLAYSDAAGGFVMRLKCGAHE